MNRPRAPKIKPPLEFVKRIGTDPNGIEVAVYILDDGQTLDEAHFNKLKKHYELRERVVNADTPEEERRIPGFLGEMIEVKQEEQESDRSFDPNNQSDVEALLADVREIGMQAVRNRHLTLAYIKGLKQHFPQELFDEALHESGNERRELEAIKHQVRELGSNGVSAEDLARIPPEELKELEAERIAGELIEGYVARINRHWEKAVEEIINTGRVLNEAKKDRLVGQRFGDITKRLKIKWRTANRLMSIARHPILSDSTHVSKFPPHWGTLYYLSRIAPDVLLSHIESGKVHTDMKRTEAMALTANLYPKLGPAIRVLASTMGKPVEEIALALYVNPGKEKWSSGDMHQMVRLPEHLKRILAALKHNVEERNVTEEPWDSLPVTDERRREIDDLTN